MFCLICLYCIELSVLIFFGSYTPVGVQLHCYDVCIYIYIYHYLQLLSEYVMYYAYTYDICKCIMCHANKIFESLRIGLSH